MRQGTVFHCVVGLIVSVCGAAVANGELVGLWTFNEGSGTIAYDTSDNYNDASLMNSPTFVTSPGGKAVSLNGTNQYVNMGSPAVFNLKGAVTVEAWVKVDTLASGEPLIFGKDTTLYGISYYYNNGRSYFYGGSTGNNNLSSAVSTGAWHHIVGTTDASVSGTNMRLYVDGTQVASRTSLGNPTDSTNVNLIAGANRLLNNFLKGQIDELRLYNHVLSASEISANYAAGPIKTTYVATTNDLASLIEAATDNTQFVLAAGTHNVSSDINIGKKRIQIVGKGKYNTTVKAATNVPIIFDVESDVEDLKIHKMKIEGTPPQSGAYGTHGIGSNGGTTNVRRVTFKDLLVTDLAVGISVGSGLDGSNNPYIYDTVLIERNALVNLLGIDSGHGYGIHNDTANNVIIRRNYIEKADRHSIYQGRVPIGGSILIENNFSLNHDYYSKQTTLPGGYVESAAIAIARSPSVKCADNLVVNSRTYSMSVEYDNVHGWTMNDVHLVNNQIIGSHEVGLWGNTGTSINDLFTRITHCTTNSSQTVKPDNNPVTSQPTTFVFPNSRWQGANFITYLDGKVYVMKNGTLDEVVPYTWTYRTSPTNWFSTQGMSAMNGRLYVVQNSVLHEVNPADWSYRYDNVNSWGSTQHVTATNGYVYIIKSNVMYRVNPTNWSYISSSTGWSGVQVLYNWDGDPYCMQSDSQYRINASTLAKTGIGG